MFDVLEMSLLTHGPRRGFSFTVAQLDLRPQEARQVIHGLKKMEAAQIRGLHPEVDVNRAGSEVSGRQ